MRAILADIHGNLEALHAVVHDARNHSVSEFYCLGDIVGYGPNPVECLDIVTSFAVVLQGDFDEAVSGTPLSNRHSIQQAIDRTRRQIVQSMATTTPSGSRMAFLAQLPHAHRELGLLFVHGSPRDPVHEYVFPEDVYNARKLQSIFQRVDGCCFVGHTHIPGIFAEDLRWVTPAECDEGWLLGGQKVLCNVGSVGQSHDSDPRACYVLFDGKTIRYRRVVYDVQATLRKLRDLGDDYA
jgi:predicted phosphodiesterase